jgi:hypothetical protein
MLMSLLYVFNWCHRELRETARCWGNILFPKKRDK